MSCIHKARTGPVRGFNGSDQERSSELYPGNVDIPDAMIALVRRKYTSPPPFPGKFFDIALLNELAGIA